MRMCMKIETVKEKNVGDNFNAIVVRTSECDGKNK